MKISHHFGTALLAVSLWGVVAFAASAAPHDAQAASADEAVRAFENTLRDTASDKERTRLARQFFAHLNTRDLKQAAIGLTNNRYKYSIPPDTEMELLVGLARDRDAVVREKAVDAIRYVIAAHRAPIGSHAREIIAFSQDAGPAIRKNAWYAMAGSGDARFRDVFTRGLSSINAETHTFATALLGEYLTANMEHDLSGFLMDARPEVRARAVQSVASLSVFNQQMLQAALRDRSEQVQKAAAEGLAKLKP